MKFLQLLCRQSILTDVNNGTQPPSFWILHKGPEMLRWDLKKHKYCVTVSKWIFLSICTFLTFAMDTSIHKYLYLW